MKCFFMHLMPYADLDLDYDKKYNTPWVTFPNSYYDPAKGAKLYNRYIDELVYADEVGFDGVLLRAAQARPHRLERGDVALFQRGSVAAQRR